MFERLKALWCYRAFVRSSIANEFKVRYARSRLGIFWFIFQPFSQVLIYALILSKVLASKMPGVDSPYAYVIYLMAGTLAWSLFSEIVTRLLTLFIDQANLIKKMQFPRIALPAIVVGSALVNHLMLLVATILIFICMGHLPGVAFFWLPILTLCLVTFSVGVGLTLGVLNVFIRDLTQVVPLLMQLIFWATPIVYPIAIIPERLQHLLIYNPLYPLVSAYQDILLQSISPQVDQFKVIVPLACAFVALGYYVFRRASPEMVDVL
jgi:lipopolysaccharide transport system permease protein